MISRRDAKVVMDRLHGRTFQAIADEHGFNASRAQQIYKHTVIQIGYRYAQSHPRYNLFTIWKEGAIPEGDAPLVGVLLRERTHPRQIDPDTPEGFVARGEIRTGRRWED